MSQFRRPENLTFPHTYSTFKAKDKNSDNIIEYRVQDLPEKYYDEAIESMVKYFLPIENICVSRKISQNPQAIEDLRSFWSEKLKYKLSIACFKNDGSEELVALNLLKIGSIDDERNNNSSWENQFQDQNVIDIFKALIHAKKRFDVFERCNVKECLSAYGLCVNPAYQGRGIATEMLKARAPIMKALGLQVTSTLFTGIGVQLAARKAGYEERDVMSFADIQKLDPLFDFSKCDSKEIKTMILTV